MSSKGGKSQTVTTQPPGYIMDAQKDLISAGEDLYAPFYGIETPYMLAGFTPDQQMGMTMMRNFGLAGPGQGFGGGIAQQIANQTAGASGSNPYTDEVVETTLANMDKRHGREIAALKGRRAKSKSFGGSRGALSEERMVENHSAQRAQAEAKLRSEAYDRGLTKTQNDQKLALAAGGEMSRANMAKLQFYSGLANGLYNFGGQQQGLNQRAIDIPFTALNNYSGIVNGTAGQAGKTQETPLTSNPLAGVMGGISAGAGLFGEGGALAGAMGISPVMGAVGGGLLGLLGGL
jgi:hypothetical protein